MFAHNRVSPNSCLPLPSTSSTSASMAYWSNRPCAQIGALPGADLELARPLGRVQVDPEAADPPAPLVAMPAIDDLENLVALPKTFLHEGQQQPILLVRVVEERAGMATVLERRACQSHGTAFASHSRSLACCCW